MEEFNPAAAIERLGIICNVKSGSSFMEQLKSLNDSVAFMQKLHDEAFEAGYLKGIEFSKNIDNYESN